MRPNLSCNSPAAGTDRHVAARLFCALAIFAALLGSTAPSPLYPQYAAQWKIGQGAVNALFAVYSLGTLFSLVLGGVLSDRVPDRRWMILPALATVAAGAFLMAIASSLPILFLGRFLAGVGTGAITGTATAALSELDPSPTHGRAAVIATLAFTGGAAIGPTVSSIAIAGDLFPRVTPFLFIVALSLLVIAGLVVSPWSRPRNTTKATVPKLAEATDPVADKCGKFALSALTICVAWMVGSALMAVGPAVAISAFDLQSAATAGLFPVAFQVFAGCGQFAFGRMRHRTAIRVGLAGLGLTQTAVAVASATGTASLLLVTIPISGLVYGAAFVGAAGLVSHSASPNRRGSIISRFYAIGYLANALPVLAMGFLADQIGLRQSFSVFSAIVLILAVLGIIATIKSADVRAYITRAMK